MRKLILLLLIALLISVPSSVSQTSGSKTAQSNTLDLPSPATTGGMPLMDALAKRRSSRSFTGTALMQPEIAQLLWAAQGITDTKGHRTAPSAMAKYFLTIYIATAEGLFQYIPDGHKLVKISSTDLRSNLSPQPSISSAPAVFIITGDYNRATQSIGASGTRCVDLEAGHATQNLLLQAVALQLAGVPAGGIDPDQVAKAASLPSTSRPIYLVPVGHPK